MIRYTINWQVVMPFLLLLKMNVSLYAADFVGGISSNSNSTTNITAADSSRLQYYDTMKNHIMRIIDSYINMVNKWSNNSRKKVIS